jgi:hypothetical protein
MSSPSAPPPIVYPFTDTDGVHALNPGLFALDEHGLPTPFVHLAGSHTANGLLVPFGLDDIPPLVATSVHQHGTAQKTYLNNIAPHRYALRNGEKYSICIGLHRPHPVPAPEYNPPNAAILGVAAAGHQRAFKATGSLYDDRTLTGTPSRKTMNVGIKHAKQMANFQRKAPLQGQVSPGMMESLPATLASLREVLQQRQQHLSNPTTINAAAPAAATGAPPHVAPDGAPPVPGVAPHHAGATAAATAAAPDAPHVNTDHGKGPAVPAWPSVDPHTSSLQVKNVIPRANGAWGSDSAKSFRVTLAKLRWGCVQAAHGNPVYP